MIKRKYDIVTNDFKLRNHYWKRRSKNRNWESKLTTLFE